MAIMDTTKTILLICAVTLLLSDQLFLAANSQLPNQCDTAIEQKGPACQSLCNCDCTAINAQEKCQRVCRHPNGTGAIPWCESQCTEDDDDGFVEHMKNQSLWDVHITACVDAPSCNEEIASFCCAHCKDVDVTLEMPWADDDDPVQVYMSLGQSNCAGSASADLMKYDGAHPELFEKNTTKSKVWFAGLTSRGSQDSFGISALWAGCVGDKHGPEFAYGYRLQGLTGKRVLIFKYCMGGTSAKMDWNPDWQTNYWNKTKDNNTAAFLKDLRMGDPKRQQYLRYTYNLRLMREQLNAAGVEFEFKAIFWRQSSADQDSDWKQYGADQIRVFNAMRAELGVPNLPIIFEGDSSRTNIQAAKVYAARVLCNATVGVAITGQQHPDSVDICNPTTGNTCLEYQIFQGEMENQFGWDVNFPNDSKVPRPGFSNAKARWFVRFQAVGDKAPNLHDEYDGMWYNGIAMANAYVREHTSFAVPHAMTEWDKWAKWPGKRCTIENPWREENLCWEDPSAECDMAQEKDAPAGMCSSVTAESCRIEEAHYTQCPCACLHAATCIAEPPVIDPATLTYYPDVIGSPSSSSTTPQQCMDDNAAIIELARQAGRSISGCTDPRVKWVRVCTFETVKESCCASCTAATEEAVSLAPEDSSGPTTENSYSMQMGNPFVDSTNLRTEQISVGSTNLHGCGIFAPATAALAVFMCR